jgi:cytochrome b561
MSLDTREKLSPTTIILHWLVAIGIISLIALGLYMEQTEAFALYSWHKSFGVLVFVFACWRVAARFYNGWPTPVAQVKNWEHLVARGVHYLLIIGTLLMPISGMIMSGVGGHGVYLFALELVPSNPDPINPRNVIAFNESITSFGHSLHAIGSKILIIAIVVHIAAALKHHWKEKDGTLKRMLGKEI